MIDLTSLPPIATLPAFFLIGVALGIAYFCALRRTANLIVSCSHPLFGLALTFGRIALLGLGFYIAVLFGGFTLLSALAGALCGKALILSDRKGVSL